MSSISQIMPSYTLKNISSELHQALQSAAKATRRSVNSEILMCLEAHYLDTELSNQKINVKRQRIIELCKARDQLLGEDFVAPSIEQIVADVKAAREK